MASRLTPRGAALRPATKFGYRNALDDHILPAFGDLPLDEITTAAVRTWRGQFAAGGTDSAGAKAYGVLQAILQTAEDNPLDRGSGCPMFAHPSSLRKHPGSPCLSARPITRAMTWTSSRPSQKTEANETRDIVTVSGAVYARKARPALVVQDDRFDATESVTVVPFTSAEVDAPLLRVPVTADEDNGMGQDSFLIVDKITTVRRSNVGTVLGRLGATTMVEFETTPTHLPGLRLLSRRSQGDEPASLRRE